MLAAAVEGQDSGRTLLSAAKKRALDARGKEGEARAVVLEDCARLLAAIPERFPDEKPAVARAWLELGRVHNRLDRTMEATAAFERVLEIKEEHRTCCDALHELASIHRKKKRPEVAIAALDRIVAEFPSQSRSRARALIRMASLHRGVGRIDRAEVALNRCMKEHGDLWRQSVDALNALVSLKLKVNDPQVARRVLDAGTASLRARFAGTKDEQRLEAALAKMTSRVRVAKAEGREPLDG